MSDLYVKISDKWISHEQVGLHNLTNLSPFLIQRLLKKGFLSLIDLIVRGPLDIMDALGVKSIWGQKVAERLTKDSLSILEGNRILDKFSSAEELLKMRQHAHRISTGSGLLDRLLKGGIETGAVTEIYGKNNDGRLHLCYTLAILVQQDIRLGGLGGKALFVDTKKRFGSEPLYQFAAWRGHDPETVLKNVLVVKPTGVAEMENTIKTVGSLIYKNNIKLIVFDSFLYCYNRKYYGRENLAAKQETLNRHMSMLKSIASIYDVAIVLANESRLSRVTNVGQEINTVGGNILAHNSTYKISFKKYRHYKWNKHGMLVRTYDRYNRIAKIVNSPYQPPEETFFAIDGYAGIVDCKTIEE